MAFPDDERVHFHPESETREMVARRFELFKSRLVSLVPGADVQHVGSTAVPGSLTKGDLDIQIRLPAEEYSQAKEILSGIYEVNSGGFTAVDGVSFESEDTEPSIGIHLTVIGGSCDVQYRFRDILLSSPALRRDYNELKQRFDGSSMKEYRDAKAYFVERVLPVMGSVKNVS